MTEPTGWRHVIGHEGTFLATLDLWDAARAGKTRHLQSGYRALWSLADTVDERAIETGPIDLVDARSLAPGTSGNVLIHPMQPERWRSIGPGARLTLVTAGSSLRVLGQATVVERRDVPASARLNLAPVEETEGRVRLRAATGPPSGPPSPAAPPPLTVGAVPLPLLTSSWGEGENAGNVPRSDVEELELAARLPALALEPGAPVRIAVDGAPVPVLAEIAYFARVDAAGVPAGERRGVHVDHQSMLRDVEPTSEGWALDVPAVEDAQAVVIMLTFAPAVAGAEHRLASWGFRLRPA